MVEFILFTAAIAVIAFLVKNIQLTIAQPKNKLQPIKIERKEERLPHSRKRNFK